MPEVSHATSIDVGLGGPKLRPKGVGDGQPVDIPAPLVAPCGVSHGVRRGRRSDAAMEMPGLHTSPCQEKPRAHGHGRPYRKPTQVGEENILRRTSDPSLRNSAN
jgi:hypothetical protein